MTQFDVAGKSDAELLEIWRDQVDYRDEVVDWVGAEIARRNLNTEHLEFMTVDDQIKRDEKYDASVRALRPLLKWGMFGLTLLALGLSTLWKEGQSRDSIGSTIGVGAIVIGAFFLFLARRAWKHTGM